MATTTATATNSPQVWAPPPAAAWDPGDLTAPRIRPIDPYPWPDGYPPIDSLEANLRWRAKAIARATRDPQYAKALRRMCEQDCAFWWAGFCWIFETRSTGDVGSTLPFIPYRFQLAVEREMEISLNDGEDFASPKSRDMGMTWVSLLKIQHRWQFKKGFTALLASLKQDLVDKLGDKNTLFEKIRFNLYKQPDFLMPPGFKPKQHDKSLLLINEANGCEISGVATTGEVGRGGRFNVVMVDEHASIPPSEQSKIEGATADATRSRWYISTPRGNQEEFHRKCHSETVRRFDVHWALHPNKGYLSWCEISYKPMKDGGHRVIRGKTRSPWYDYEVKRRNQPEWMVAQELDISFEGSTESIADFQTLKIWRENAPDPIEERWKQHRTDGKPALFIYERPIPGVQYIIGGDPSRGTATGSHTSVQVFRADSLAQVAEYQGRVGLDVLSAVVYALGKEYNWAYVCIESNIGTSVLTDLSKGFIDHDGVAMGTPGKKVRPYPDAKIARNAKADGTQMDDLGIHTGGASKQFMVYSLMEPMVRNQECLVRGVRTINELSGFKDEGKKLHNPDGDDLVMSLNVLLYGHRFRRKKQSKDPVPFLAT